MGHVGLRDGETVRKISYTDVFLLFHDHQFLEDPKPGWIREDFQVVSEFVQGKAPQATGILRLCVMNIGWPMGAGKLKQSRMYSRAIVGLMESATRCFPNERIPLSSRKKERGTGQSVPPLHEAARVLTMHHPE